MNANGLTGYNGSRFDAARKIAILELKRSCKVPFDKAIGHLEKVQSLIGKIAEQRNLNVDICRTAAIMHDLWLYRHSEYTSEILAAHGPKGAVLACELLNTADYCAEAMYSEAELSTISRMIERHDFLDTIDDAYCEALKDADVLANGRNREK